MKRGFGEIARTLLDGGAELDAFSAAGLGMSDWLAGRDTALDATARTLEVRYDLWDEDFRIVERDGAGHRTSRLAGVEAVRRLAGSVEDLPAFDRRLLSPGRRYYVAVVGQVDPLSDEQLSEVRSWLSRPQAGHRDLALGGRSFLGSFVSLFVNVKVGQAARELRFRSQTFATGDLQAARAAGATP